MHTFFMTYCIPVESSYVSCSTLLSNMGEHQSKDCLYSLSLWHLMNNALRGTADPRGDLSNTIPFPVVDFKLAVNGYVPKSMRCDEMISYTIILFLWCIRKILSAQHTPTDWLRRFTLQNVYLMLLFNRTHTNTWLVTLKHSYLSSDNTNKWYIDVHLDNLFNR